MDTKKAKILLIEDDRMLCDMYKVKFEISGLNIFIAYGGYDGLAIAKKEKSDIVLLDIKMDDIDGFEVLKRMKADPSLKDIPVFLLTNMGEKDNIEKGKALGAEEYIMKAKLLPQEVVNKVVKKLKSI